TEHIGISGGDKLFGDSLEPDGSLLPAVTLSGPSKRLYQRSRNPPTSISLERNGIHIGRQRLGILTRPHRGRPQYVFDGRDFFRRTLCIRISPRSKFVYWGTARSYF